MIACLMHHLLVLIPRSGLQVHLPVCAEAPVCILLIFKRRSIASLCGSTSIVVLVRWSVVFNAGHNILLSTEVYTADCNTLQA